MRIDASGNVGIGTAPSAARVTIFGSGTTATIADFSNGVNANFEIKTASSLTTIGPSVSAPLAFQINSTERMRIDASGNVVIGSTSAIGNFSVVTPDGVSARRLAVGHQSGYPSLFSRDSDGTTVTSGFWDAQQQIFTNAGTERMRIDNVGNVGIGTSSPADKLHVSATGTLYGSGYIVSRHMNAVSEKGVFLGYDADENAGTIGGANFLTFQTYNAANAWGERMRIDREGNVGIGTTAPISGYKLTMEGNGAYAALRCVTSAGFSALSGFDGATQRWSVGQLGFGGNNGLGFYVGSGTEVGRFDANGNLLVGATSGSGAISVARGAGVSAFVEIAGNGNTIGSTSMIVGQDTSSNAYCWNRANAVLLFGTNNTERARIDATGNLLVGTTSTTMGQTGIIMQPAISGEVGNIDIGHANGTAEGNPYARFYYNATSIGSITQSGTTAVLYNTSSDVRLKHDIIDAPDASNLIDALQVRSFKWNADNSEQRYGFVAQELLEVAPEAVSQPADPDDMMGVDYSKLVPMLVKEIQSLRARVAQLEGN
jgi:hypothetical protein